MGMQGHLGQHLMVEVLVPLGELHTPSRTNTLPKWPLLKMSSCWCSVRREQIISSTS